RTEEETAPFPEIVLPQRGAYIRRDCAGAVYLDRTTIGYFEAGKPYTIEHPKQRPDVTTVISLISPDALSDALDLPNDAPLFACAAVRASPAVQIMHRHLLQRLAVAEAFELEERAVELTTAAILLGRIQRNELVRDDASDIATAVAERLQEA